MAQITQETATPPFGARIKDDNGYPTAYRYVHIASSTTTEVKGSAGILHSVTINTKGATANTATIYDNTSGTGTIIAVIDTTAGVGTLIYDIACSTGITIVTASGTAADITVAYV